jgi:hypothetical protein
MAKDKSQVAVFQEFEAGKKVALIPRVGDWWVGANTGNEAASATADKEGSVKIDVDASVGAPFWAVQNLGKDEERTIKVTAKAPRDDPFPSVEQRAELRAPEPEGEVVVGASDTVNSRAKPAPARHSR